MAANSLIKVVLLVLLSVCCKAQDSRQFLVVTTFSALSTVADASTTIALVGNDRCPVETWSAPLYGETPKPIRTIAVMGGLFVLSAFASYELKRHRAHIWKLPLWPLPEGYLAFSHTSGTAHNLRYCR